jgi:hypothetical protein
MNTVKPHCAGEPLQQVATGTLYSICVHKSSGGFSRQNAANNEKEIRVKATKIDK